MYSCDDLYNQYISFRTDIKMLNAYDFNDHQNYVNVKDGVSKLYREHSRLFQLLDSYEYLLFQLRPKDTIPIFNQYQVLEHLEKPELNLVKVFPDGSKFYYSQEIRLDRNNEKVCTFYITKAGEGLDTAQYVGHVSDINRYNFSFVSEDEFILNEKFYFQKNDKGVYKIDETRLSEDFRQTVLPGKNVLQIGNGEYNVFEVNGDTETGLTKLLLFTEDEKSDYSVSTKPTIFPNGSILFRIHDNVGNGGVKMRLLEKNKESKYFYKSSNDLKIQSSEFHTCFVLNNNFFISNQKLYKIINGKIIEKFDLNYILDQSSMVCGVSENSFISIKGRDVMLTVFDDDGQKVKSKSLFNFKYSVDLHSFPEDFNIQSLSVTPSGEIVMKYSYTAIEMFTGRAKNNTYQLVLGKKES